MYHQTTVPPSVADLNARDLKVTIDEAMFALSLGRQSERRGVSGARKVYAGIAAATMHRSVARMAEREGIETTGWSL